MDDGRPWTTPSDLAEYTFCPRAHHYRTLGAAPASVPASEGARYHHRTLGAERWRDEHRGAPWLAIVAGVLLVAVAVAVLVL